MHVSLTFAESKKKKGGQARKTPAPKSGGAARPVGVACDDSHKSQDVDANTLRSKKKTYACVKKGYDPFGAW